MSTKSNGQTFRTRDVTQTSRGCPTLEHAKILKFDMLTYRKIMVFETVFGIFHDIRGLCSLNSDFR